MLLGYNPEFARRQRRDAAAIPAQVWQAIADQSLIGVDLRFMLQRVQAPGMIYSGKIRRPLPVPAACSAMGMGSASSASP